MPEHLKNMMRSALYFGWILVPVSAVFGLAVFAMAAHGDPRNAVLWAFIGAFSVLLPPILGFVLASWLTGPSRCRQFREHGRWFPTACALVFCAFALSGAVENSTDIVQRWVSHRFGLMLFPASAFAWSFLGTLVVAASDRLVDLRQRRSRVPEP